MPQMVMTTGERVGAPEPGPALLVRVSAGPGWLRTLPPVPDGRTVTASVSHPGLALVAADDLVTAGYRIVGVSGAATGPGRRTVDLLVETDLIAAHPDWWQSLCERAERVFNPVHGPVALLLGPILDLHRSAR